MACVSPPAWVGCGGGGAGPGPVERSGAIPIAPRRPADSVAGMSDKIIRFPGAAAKPGAAPAPRPPAAGQEEAPADGLSDEQRKAAQIVLSGMPFVLVGIKPTDRGADFFTAVHGDHTDLRNAQPHLAGVIERAYSRKGI